MRGKRGTPSIWSGADETTGAAELGIELEGEGDPVDPPTSPGGTAGVITKGESGSELELEAAGNRPARFERRLLALNQQQLLVTTASILKNT